LSARPCPLDLVHQTWSLGKSVANAVKFHIRQAVPADVRVLEILIAASVRGLQAQDYSAAQLEGALRTVYGVDSQLIADGTYFVAEARIEAGIIEAEIDEAKFDEPAETSKQSEPVIVGCGGWSKRKTLYGGDHWTGRHDELLDPLHDAAKIRAFFIHPDWARRGIGSLILAACENAARAAGFTRLEMGATLTGVPFYRAKGYTAMERQEVPLDNGQSLPIVRMVKGA
jgi:GNAT superfamily N-acetyltransferase